ncbi:unnamed protein product [Lactuca virosa]|uniref:Uncharacterized protein n=1 Tax=Lactuca virosa TaxID=75947 RepID=A0AAU9MD01_9ASTR|nr:unnamed protein product [Lactuca virosa]
MAPSLQNHRPPPRDRRTLFCNRYFPHHNGSTTPPEHLLASKKHRPPPTNDGHLQDRASPITVSTSGRLELRQNLQPSTWLNRRHWQALFLSLQSLTRSKLVFHESLESPVVGSLSLDIIPRDREAGAAGGPFL